MIKRFYIPRYIHVNGKSVVLLFLLVLLPLLVFQVRQQQILKQEAASAEKPNIIIILSDDQPDNTMNFIPGVRDSLGSKGVTFTNAYVTTGLCCPSRSSILTGQYAHNHGVFTNRPPMGGVTKFKDKETLPVWLKRAGYKTSLVGKYLNEYNTIAPYVPPGWDNWVAFDDDNGKYFDYKLTDNGKSESYGDSEKDYSTDVLAKKAVKFIKKTKEPFFLYFAPHTPHGVPRPAPRDENICDNAPLKKPPSFNEEDVSDKPSWVQKLPRLSDNDIKAQEDEFKRKMCTLKALDDAASDIIKALGTRRDNTIIIYLSDNGYVFGEHRHTQKECFYEECVAVDMLISYPKLTTSKATNNQFALNIDLAPTILELAAIDVPASVDGKSLVPLLEGKDTALHDNFLIETYNNEEEPKGEDYGIRKGNYKYQELFSGEKELYDLSKDPNELVNVAGKEEYKTIQDELAVALATGKENKISSESASTLPPGDGSDSGKDKKNKDKKKDKNKEKEEKDKKDSKEKNKANRTPSDPEKAACRMLPNLPFCNGGNSKNNAGSTASNTPCTTNKNSTNGSGKNGNSNTSQKEGTVTTGNINTDDTSDTKITINGKEVAAAPAAEDINTGGQVGGNHQSNININQNGTNQTDNQSGGNGNQQSNTGSPCATTQNGKGNSNTNNKNNDSNKEKKDNNKSTNGGGNSLICRLIPRLALCQDEEKRNQENKKREDDKKKKDADEKKKKDDEEKKKKNKDKEVKGETTTTVIDIIKTCIGEDNPSKCTPDMRAVADVNGDTKINQLDYNLATSK